MFELFYEKFVPGQISDVPKLKRGDTRDPGLKIARRDAHRFTEDLAARRSKLGLLRRAPLEEAT